MADNGEKVTYFAETDARGRRVKFGIKAKDRTKHVYVIGKTGMGKSTLLENMAIQDIQNGEGLAFVDPHGSSAEKLLDYVPEERINDVLYFAPFDLEHPVSFNILEDMGPNKRHLVVNGLMSTFEKIWADMWSARMSYILQNTIQALLEYPDATLLGINRVLIDKNYRKKVVDNVTDPAVKAFWIEEFAKYTDRYTQEATPAIQNKVGQFVSNPLIRNIIGQPNSAFDIREMMDTKKILIVNLSKGKVGEGNANLLGGMLITRIYLAAMSRADASERELAKLPNFYLYVDEFQSFANKTFENILSEARKYKLNLTIAHQYIEQMEEEVRNAVFGNVGTMITFRVGAYDAEVLEKEFAPTFYADNLVNLGVYQMYLKLMIDGVSSAPFSATSMAPIAPSPLSFREQVISYTRDHFGRPRAKVEADIEAWHQAIMPDEALPLKKGYQGKTVLKQENTGERAPRDHREPRMDQREHTVQHKTEEKIEHRTEYRRENERSGNGSAGAPRPFSERQSREDVLARTRSILAHKAEKTQKFPSSTEQSFDGKKTHEENSDRKHDERQVAGSREQVSLRNLKAHTRNIERGQSGNSTGTTERKPFYNNKTQTPSKHREELRNALSTVLSTAPVFASSIKNSVPQKESESLPKQNSPKPQNEIPEDTLRKILNTDDTK